MGGGCQLKSASKPKKGLREFIERDSTGSTMGQILRLKKSGAVARKPEKAYALVNTKTYRGGERGLENHVVFLGNGKKRKKNVTEGATQKYTKERESPRRRFQHTKNGRKNHVPILIDDRGCGGGRGNTCERGLVKREMTFVTFSCLGGTCWERLRWSEEDKRV